MAFEVEGRLHRKMDEQQVTASFKKREFVLETMDGQYPQLVKFEAVQDKTSLLDNCQEGDTIKVTFDLSGREYNAPDGKVSYFTNLRCWKLEKVAGGGGSIVSPPQTPGGGVPFPTSNDAPPVTGGQDDLPF